MLPRTILIGTSIADSVREKDCVCFLSKIEFDWCKVRNRFPWQTEEQAKSNPDDMYRYASLPAKPTLRPSSHLDKLLKILRK